MCQSNTMAMKQLTISIFVLLCLLTVSCKKAEAPLKISIFCDHIETIARQENISFAEAATRVKEFGYAGADIRVTQSPDEIKTLDSLGFAHACAISEINYSRENTWKNMDLTN